MFLNEGYWFRFLEGYTSGFSLSFKVDSQDVNVGGLAINIIVVGDLRISFPHFIHLPQEIDSSDLKLPSFLAGWWHLMRTLIYFDFYLYKCKTYGDIFICRWKRKSTKENIHKVGQLTSSAC